MIVKPLLAVALATAPVPVRAPISITYDEQRTNTQYPLVHQVRCHEGSGSAFRVGSTRFLSVAHVTAMHECAIDGDPITVIEQDGKNDFAIVEAGRPKAGAFKISCAGFQTSKWYWATGYAWALPYQTTVAIYASGFSHENGQRLFYGKHSVIPGQSGAAVLDPDTGEVVGTVNMYNPLFGYSYSRALRDTSVCGADHA